MNEIEAKIILSAETKNKAKEVYKVLIDKLYNFFVVDEKEARLETIISLLDALDFVTTDLLPSVESVEEEDML